MADKQQAASYHQQMLDKMRRSGVFQASGVEAAFAAVPRHLFLPDMPLETVYQDRAITLTYGGGGIATSSASQPTMMAIMLNQAQLKPGDNVLEIGAATGYNAAIMKHIVGEDGSVTTVEIDKDLAERARQSVLRAHVGPINVVEADGARGYSPRASYDHIIATVGVWDVPQDWFQQLKPDGSVIVPIVIDGVQVSAVFKPQSDGTYLSTENRPCQFVYLRGTFAGPNIRKRMASTAMYLIADQIDEIDTAALHLLLSNDHDLCYLESPLERTDFWFGFQLYLMLNEPPGFVFGLYNIFEGQTAYGIEGRGLALFTRSSAALANYEDRGTVHCYAGADAFLAMQRTLDEWNTIGRPTMRDLHLRLIPKSQPRPTVERGKIYDRRDHYLHAWLAT